MKSISHSPNSDWKQQLLAASYLFLPWKWGRLRSGSDIHELEKQLADMHGGGEAITFSTGRECLFTCLKALGITPGDEVILQGYTCIVVPNAILFAGAKPVYVDVDETLNINPDLIEKQITEKTKAIIVQHTFGVPADMDRIIEVAKKHHLRVIEDCAHSLGAEYDGKPVGTFGDLAFYSFGRDKIISSVSGGAVYAQDFDLIKKVRELQAKAANRSYLWIKQNLLHPLLVPWMARLMRVKIGSVLMILAQQLHLLNKVYTNNELCQQVPVKTIHKLPNAMATMALQQLSGLEDNLLHRIDLANYAMHLCDEKGIKYQAIYESTRPVFLRFTALLENPSNLQDKAKSAGYLLGNWYTDIVMPRPASWKKIHLDPKSLPESKKYTEANLNLPTSRKFTKSDLEKLLKLAKKQDESK